MPAATTSPTRRQLQEQLTAERDTNLLLQESIADLQVQLSDPGWVRLIAQADVEFAPEGLRQLRAICRLFAVKNPLIKRGLALRSAYVWGSGMEASARANGRRDQPGEQDVNEVVQAFLDDEANRRAVTSPAARDQLERALGTDGELFFCLFTRPATGWVQVRVLLADEIAEVIANPDDASEPWYYRRRWVERTLDPATGGVGSTSREKLYPAVGYRPASRPSRFGTIPVAWDSPVLHMPVNRPLGWQRGLPDAYAAIDWARAYKEFLEDWARLMKSLARFAWRMTTKGQAQAQARARIAAAPTVDRTGQPLAAAATALLPPDAALEAIPKTGATIDSGSGRPLAMMVAAALGLPVTMLLADPGQTGARATAETLDQPTELEMAQRQAMWTGVYQRILTYVIAESVRAPKGRLKGVITKDENGRERVALAGDTATTVDVTWPDLDDVDPAVLVEAIVKADATGTMPPELVLRLLLTALGVQQVDELVEAMLDENGDFQWPAGRPISPGQAAMDAARLGQDPAAVDGGPMTPAPNPPADAGGQPAVTGE